MDLCLCLCLPHIGVLRPEGVFLSLGVLLPLCSLTGPVEAEMFSSDTECSPDKNSSSGSGESLSNSSTEGVSAPGGR